MSPAGGTRPFELSRNRFGRLMFIGPTGGEPEEVMAVCAFPIEARDEKIGLVNLAGHELAWINRLADLPDDLRQLVREELDTRELIPEILHIGHVSSFATPSVLQVDTDRGATSLTLKNEQDIRRVSASTLLIADGNGLYFLVRDIAALDRASRKFLDRFL